MIDIVDRLSFDATRCEVSFSRGVASNIEEAMAEIVRLRAALRQIKETYGPNHGSKFCWKMACDALEPIGHQQRTQTQERA